MQAQNVNQVKLSEQTGVAVSRVNNYLQGGYRTVSMGHLEAIVAALGNTPADKATLVQAYLFDLLPDACRGNVDIRLPGTRETGKWEVPSRGLPKDFAEKFSTLYVLCASNAKVRQRTKEWIAVMRESTG